MCCLVLPTFRKFGRLLGMLEEPAKNLECVNVLKFPFDSGLEQLVERARLRHCPRPKTPWICTMVCGRPRNQRRCSSPKSLVGFQGVEEVPMKSHTAFKGILARQTFQYASGIVVFLILCPLFLLFDLLSLSEEKVVPRADVRLGRKGLRMSDLV